MFTVPDIPIETGKPGIMTRALPTQNENGIYFFHDTKIYELICSSTLCEWGTNSQRRSIAGSGWPVVMYISSKFIDDICIDCGKNRIRGLWVVFNVLRSGTLSSAARERHSLN